MIIQGCRRCRRNSSVWGEECKCVSEVTAPKTAMKVESGFREISGGQARGDIRVSTDPALVPDQWRCRTSSNAPTNHKRLSSKQTINPLPGQGGASHFQPYFQTSAQDLWYRAEKFAPKEAPLGLLEEEERPPSDEH